MILPQSAMGAIDPVAQALMQPAPEPFVWGQGGARMSPEQVAQLRAMGQDRSRTDFSPVGHWTQGLGRVVDNVMGALDVKRAGKADDANAAADAEIAEMLAGGGADNGALARVMMDRNAGAGVRDFAKMEYARLNAPKKEVAPPEIIELARIANDPSRPAFEREAASAAIIRKNDPSVMTTLPGDRFYSGPQSGLIAAMGGGGQSSGAAQTTPPPAEAVADLKSNPGTAAQFNEIFGAGAAERILGQGGGGASRVASNFLDGL